MKEKKSILIKMYRLYHTMWKYKLYFLANIGYKITELILGCSIPPSVELGKNVNIGHPIGIVIHQDSIVGDGTIIYQNVTIGRKNRLTQDAPVIGKDCLIGAGACVFGKIVIGDNVTIGANAVVTKDIPSDSVVIGNPAVIVKRRGNP